MRPRRSEINPAPSSSHPSSIYLSYPFHPSFPFVPPILSETFRDEIMKNWNRKIIAHFHLKKKKEEEESKCFFVSITLRTNPPHFLSVISTRCPKCTLLLVSGPPPSPPGESSLYLPQDYHSHHRMQFLNVKKKKKNPVVQYLALFVSFFNFCYFLNTVKLCIQV